MPRSAPGPLVLIHPPAISRRYLKTKFLPFGMGVLAAFLRAQHVPVVQHDFLMEYLYEAPGLIDYHDAEQTFSEEEYFSFLAGGDAHAGLSAFTHRFWQQIVPGARIHAFSIVAYHQFWASLLLARTIKQHDEAAVIVFGGPFITIREAESLTRFGIADYWVKGSGESALLMLYRRHELGMDIPLANIPGLVTLSRGACLQNRPGHWPAADESPPDFKHLAIDRYRYDHPHTGRDTLFLPYRITKGCISRCSFCTGRLVDPFAAKPVDKIVGELKALAGAHASTAFMFCDSAVNSDPRLLALLCARLTDEMPEIAWYAYARIKGFDPELLRAAKQAGCFSLFWGVESASQPVIKLLGKEFSVRELSETIAHAVDVGINNHIHLVYNTPQETEEDIRALIAFIERYIACEQVTFVPHRFLLEPRSPIFRHPGRYGITRIEKAPRGAFEREQYVFTEGGQGGYARIRERDARHREMLEPYLRLIKDVEARRAKTGFPFREAM